MPDALQSHQDAITAVERAARTRELVDELASARDWHRDHVMTQLTSLYADVVEQLARRYSGRGEDRDELRQVGYVGLMKAINGYQSDRGDLLPYAVTTIAGEIKRHFRDRCWDIRPTRRVQELEMRLSAARAELQQDLGREPTVAEMADQLDETPADVRTALHSHSLFHLMSLEAPVHTSEVQSLGDAVGAADRGFDRAEANTMLRRAIAEADLSSRDRQVLALRFFHDMTQREIAAQIGVTQMQVSRILSRVLAVLHDHMCPRP